MPDESASVLIADLDDTLLNWLRFWHDPFKVLLNELHEASGIGLGTLKQEFRKLHQRHGTSESSFLIQQLPSLQKQHPDEDIAEVYDDVLHSYYSKRLGHFELYPGVRETLKKLQKIGTLVVVFTESRDYYANERIRQLKLDGLVDILYSPADHELPEDFERYYEAEKYELRHTEHRHLTEDFRKPDREILLEILEECYVSPEDVIYVGDSEMKDVRMAQDAGVRDVHALYGEGLHKDEYGLLREVSHWSDEEIEREKELKKKQDIEPTYTLKESFNEILDLFSFKEYVWPIPPGEDKKVEATLRAWEKTVDVQTHFNDIELRLRNIALTVLTAVLGAAGFSVDRGITIESSAVKLAPEAVAILLAVAIIGAFHILTDKPRAGLWGSGLVLIIGGVSMLFNIPSVSIPSVSISLASALIIVGFLVWLGFYLMDRHWYHRLLNGAVKQGEHLEKRLRAALPGVRLTDEISRTSPISSDRFRLFRIEIHSADKMNLFYFVGAGLLLFLAFALR